MSTLTDTLIFDSATSITKAIRAKEASSEEVVRAHIDRIEKVNPKLNAVVQLVAERAISEAKHLDDLQVRGTIQGPLHGLPITIKDALDTEGIISTGGTLGRKAYVPGQDAPVVSRLRQAGAVVVGKTNTPELTLGGEGGTSNEVYGRTNNAYDVSRSPGGSSGGEAAIIAAGGSPLGLGGDSGGSIRAPCHLNGIAGLKPTAGRVPRTGHILPPGGLWDSWTLIGPMARFVKDLALAFPLTAGPDGKDPFVLSMPVQDYRTTELVALRGVCYAKLDGVPIDEATVATVNAAVDAVREISFVEERVPPGIEGGSAMGDAFMRADDGEWVWRGLRAAGTSEPGRGLKLWLDQPMPHLSMKDYVELVDRWTSFRIDMTEFFESYDFIICPVMSSVAELHDEKPQDLNTHYTFAYNLTGWPAVVVRAGTSQDGLPIGVQVVAKPWREDVAFAVAEWIESRLGGWIPPNL